MTKLKLLKRLLLYPVGTIFTFYALLYKNLMDVLINLPDWFEKATDTSKRWRAEDRTMYWSLDSGLKLYSTMELHHKTDNDRHMVGNYFLTKQQARAAAAVLTAALAVVHGASVYDVDLHDKLHAASDLVTADES